MWEKIQLHNQICKAQKSAQVTRHCALFVYILLYNNVIYYRSGTDLALNLLNMFHFVDKFKEVRSQINETIKKIGNECRFWVREALFFNNLKNRLPNPNLWSTVTAFSITMTTDINTESGEKLLSGIWSTMWMVKQKGNYHLARNFASIGCNEWN